MTFTALDIALTLLFLLLGAGAGYLHFRMLRQGTSALVEEQQMRRAVVFTLGRFALTIAVLAAAAWAGAGPLLACAIGLFLGRGVLLRQEKRQPSVPQDPQQEPQP